MWGENIADETSFNKMVMTIVIYVRYAEDVQEQSGDACVISL